jgi:RNA polymerase sigma-70 factor, ECF subfamily
MDTNTHETTARLWTEFHAGLERFIAQRVNDAGDAEDVLQSLFLRLHRGLASGTEPTQARAWVYESARHAIIDFYRAKGRRRESPSGSIEDLDALGTPEGSANDWPLDDRSLATCLPYFVRQLPPTFREALELTAIQGVAQREAAERVGISEPGMKARVQRGRRHLKQAVLTCCDVHLDRRGGVASYHLRSGQESRCRAVVQAAARENCHTSRDFLCADGC